MISGAVGPGDHEHETSSIWLVSILGGVPKRLRGDAYRANLSPDDSLVAYMSHGGIWLADSDGGNPREFVGSGDWEFLGSPDWSSDGKRIIYRRLARSKAVATIESRGLDEETSIVLVRDENYTGMGIGLAFGADFLMLNDRLVYAMDEPAPRNRDQNLWEIAVDPRSGKPRGENLFQTPLQPGAGTGFQVDPSDPDSAAFSLSHAINALFNALQPGLTSGNFTNPNQVSGNLQSLFTQSNIDPNQFQNFIQQLQGGFPKGIHGLDRRGERSLTVLLSGQGADQIG